MGATYDPQPRVQGRQKLDSHGQSFCFVCFFLPEKWEINFHSANSFAAWLILCVFQGEWKPKQIDNPNYKGSWVHPEIDNPEYSADSNIYKYDNIGIIGLDLWQVREMEIILV